MHEVKGTILDVLNRRIYNGSVNIRNGKIDAIEETDDVPRQFILPGFVDAHVHIESSMLVPSEFARIAVRHGTVATVSDPHEIANVCGTAGIDFMIRNGQQVPFKFYFGAPSCVPATTFETSGATLGTDEISELLDRPDILYLAEVMNWPGVLSGESDVMAKIAAAKQRGKRVDGHAPGLTGDKASRYAAAGIETDHECMTRQEAIDKLNAGMTITIREGSAARNFDELITLLGDYPGRIMFCSDDKHPDDLMRSHINELAARALTRGHELFDTLHASCVLPVQHYGLDVGLLRPGDPGDLTVVSEPETMQVIQTWIGGACVFDHNDVQMDRPAIEAINRFNTRQMTTSDFEYRSNRRKEPVIEVADGAIVTGGFWETLPVTNGVTTAAPEQDLLKIAVINRYKNAPVAVGFVKGFGLKDGAIASSVAHDSHNIIAVGVNDEQLAGAVNLLMESGGGISALSSDRKELLPLPVAGLMSDRPGEEVSALYEHMNQLAQLMGSDLQAPYMTISFMALLVIPHFKISDLGMFDGQLFKFL